jgi:dTDP-4-amino-4,6-dideoxygalactose transaminase
MPIIPEFATNNAHMFYLIFESPQKRSGFIENMKKQNILCVFHYLRLHKSEFYKEKHDGRVLTQSDVYTETLVRLPMFYELDEYKVIQSILEFR